MIQKKNTIDPEFAEQLSSWLASKGLSHVILCLHEGAHLLYARECGFEPEVYGPSDEEIYRHGLGWRRQLGSVDSLPPEITLTADIVLVGKFFFGPACIEEKLLGEDWKQDIWDRARGDLAIYNDWCAMRQFVVGDIRLRSLFDEIRESVHQDLEQPEFQQRLMACAREYERRVFGHPEQGSV